MKNLKVPEIYPAGGGLKFVVGVVASAARTEFRFGEFHFYEPGISLANHIAPPIVIASAAGLFRRVIPPGPFANLCGVVKGGMTLDRDVLARDLLRVGFTRTQVVDDPGTFVVRGSVIDVFSPVYRHPVRIELFGDEVESLRLFDAATQRTLRPVERLVFHAARETVASEGADPRGRILAAADHAAYPSSKTRSILESIDAGESFFGIAEELLQLYAQRRALPGHAFPAPDVVFGEFEESFAFDETPDQARAIRDVLGDMQADTLIDRLVCGDVGYGKTEVALRAALLAVLGGRQVAVLAPTRVLVEQHFVTFSERFSDFPVRVASLSRFRKPAEQKRIVRDIAAGKVDVVVGTHRLLSVDTTPPRASSIKLSWSHTPFSTMTWK